MYLVSVMYRFLYIILFISLFFAIPLTNLCLILTLAPFLSFTIVYTITVSLELALQCIAILSYSLLSGTRLAKSFYDSYKPLLFVITVCNVILSMVDEYVGTLAVKVVILVFMRIGIAMFCSLAHGTVVEMHQHILPVYHPAVVVLGAGM